MKNLSSQHHSFDISLAEKYGIEEAILIHHFQHWIRINKSLKRNFHDGRTWTYQSLDEIAANFPYLNKSKVYDILEKLCTGTTRKSKKVSLDFEPVLIKGNFNKSPYDRTVWYAFVEEENYILGNPKIENGTSQSSNWEIPTPIPDTIPDTKPKTVCPTTPVGSSESQKVVKKFTTDGKEISLERDDVYRSSVQKGKNWTGEEIEQAWKILCDYEGRVNDLWRFIEGTVENLRKKQNIENLRNSAEKERKCQGIHTGQPGRIPSKEEIAMLTQPSPARDLLMKTLKECRIG